MWVIYHKPTLTIAGLSADTGQDVAKAIALQEVVAGLHNARDASEYDAIQELDRTKAARYMAAFPARLALVQRDGQLRLSIRDPEFFQLHVTTDAPDVHPADGVPEIRADGTASALISVAKIDERGKPMRTEGDNDKIYLRTDYGVLRDRAGREQIREISLVKGEAQFRLVSEPVRRMATVRLFNADGKLRNATLRVEFV